jgi:hypothetical protein
MIRKFVLIRSPYQLNVRIAYSSPDEAVSQVAPLTKLGDLGMLDPRHLASPLFLFLLPSIQAWLHAHEETRGTCETETVIRDPHCRDLGGF